MNLPQWITLVAMAVTCAITFYVIAVVHWLNSADFDAPEPWWVSMATRVIDRDHQAR